MLKNFSIYLKKNCVAIGLAGFGLAAVGCYTAFDYYQDPVEKRVRKISKCMVHDLHVQSARFNDVKLIRKQLTLEPYQIGNKFTHVIGPYGVGKTLAVKTAAKNLKGVFEIGLIRPGADEDEILSDVCHKITDRSGSFNENRDFMKSVIDLYRWHTGKMPIIIFRTYRCFDNEAPARLTAAAQTLVADFGLNVLIDSSENDLDNLNRIRNVVIELEPMSDEMMRNLPEFTGLFEILKRQGYEEVVLAVCGGSPPLLDKLNQDIKLYEIFQNDEQMRTIVSEFVLQKVVDAYREITTLIMFCPKIKDVLQMFEGKENHKISTNILNEIKLDEKGMQYLNKVFREIQLQDDEGMEMKSYLVPIESAVSTFLRIGSLENKPNFGEIKANVLKWSKQKKICDCGNEK